MLIRASQVNSLLSSSSPNQHDQLHQIHKARLFSAYEHMSIKSFTKLGGITNQKIIILLFVYDTRSFYFEHSLSVQIAIKSEKVLFESTVVKNFSSRLWRNVQRSARKIIGNAIYKVIELQKCCAAEQENTFRQIKRLLRQKNHHAESVSWFKRVEIKWWESFQVQSQLPGASLESRT